MESKDLINGLSEEIKKKLAACETKEEAKKILAEAGVEPLDDEDLDKVAGGNFDLSFRRDRPYDAPVTPNV